MFQPPQTVNPTFRNTQVCAACDDLVSRKRPRYDDGVRREASVSRSWSLRKSRRDRHGDSRPGARLVVGENARARTRLRSVYNEDRVPDPSATIAEVATMRIIAGERRGHKFDGPADRETRPTSDLVREAMFNILSNEVENRLVVDLFAGTGALGLEALSRGASRAIFVEKHRGTIALIRRNIATLRFEDRSSILAVDAFRWAKSFRPVDGEPLIVFADPPWRFYEERSKSLRALVQSLVDNLRPESTVILEARKSFEAEILPELDAWDIRRYGGTQVAIRTLADARTPKTQEAEVPDVGN
jgi:16S rRNA (guanine966-N2)-methyltransferase